MGYEEKALNGQVVDVLTHGDLRIMVARAGAELVSLRREGKGFLYRDGEVTIPASGWKGHATVMGYYIHRLKQERSLYRGEEIRGGTHGFLRHKTFAAPRVEADALIYTLTEADIEPEEYPLPVDFHLTYQIKGDQVVVKFRFENQAPDWAAHVSFGLHPGWAAASLEQAEVILPAGKYRRHLAPGNFLSGEVAEFEHPGGPMPWAKRDLPDSFLVEWVGEGARTLIFEDRAGGRRVALDFREAPYFTLWSDGEAFICVEPCWGLPDHHEPRPFEGKLGQQVVPPRGALEKSFSIQPILA